jgi:tRNA wybutosine-synthesizing protein 5
MQSCKSHLGHLNAASDSSKDKGIGKESTCSDKMFPASSENSEQLYLAQASLLAAPFWQCGVIELFTCHKIILTYNVQVSILNTENKDRSSLQVLKEDIQEV